MIQLRFIGSRHIAALIKTITALSLAVGAVGCVTTPRIQIDTAARDATELRHWQASGRIAVAGPNGGGSGSFTWVQQGAEATVQIRGPVGIGSLKLMLSDRGTRVETGDGQTFDAADAEIELAARLGAAVPMQNLRYWLTGVAAPGAHEWSSTETTATLVQALWRIEYQRFAMTERTRLPAKLVAANGPAKVRILIDRWKLSVR